MGRVLKGVDGEEEVGGCKCCSMLLGLEGFCADFFLFYRLV